MDKSAYITRIGAYLPNAPVDNERMEDVLGMTGARPSRARRVILKQNGIATRHYAIDPTTGRRTHSNAALTAHAVRALCHDRFGLADLRCLVAGTSTPDQMMPNHAVMVHGELGSPPCEVVATAGICLSGLSALKYAWLAVRSGEHENAVAAGSELASVLMRAQRYAPELEQQTESLQNNPELAFEKDFLRWMLSDGAGAMLVQDHPAEGPISLRIDWIDLFSYANELPVCMYAGAEKDPSGRLVSWLDFSHEELGARSVMALKQDVKLLNASVIEYCLERPLRALIERRGLVTADIDWFLPHTSSRFFVAPTEAALARLAFAVPGERWFSNLAWRGNTGAAAMYLMLHDLVASVGLRRGQRILCVVPESGRFSTGFMHLTVV